MSNRTMKAALALVAGTSLLLAACGDDDEDTSSDTTSGATEATASGTDTTAAPTESTMATSDTTAGGPAAALVCDDITASVEEAYATTVESMDELVERICSATLADAGGTVTIMWNTYAIDQAGFDTVTTGSTETETEVAGATVAATRVDDIGASVFALVEGEGTWQVDYAPDYVSGELPAEDDLPAAVALTELLIAG